MKPWSIIAEATKNDSHSSLRRLEKISEEIILSKETKKIIDENFREGSKSHNLACELSVLKGGLSAEDIEEIARDHGVSVQTVKNVLVKLRKIGLWSDEEGGLGREKEEEDDHPDNPVKENDKSNEEKTTEKKQSTPKGRDELIIKILQDMSDRLEAIESKNPGASSKNPEKTPREMFEDLPAEEHRIALKKKGEPIEDPELQALKMLERDMSDFTVMEDLKMTWDEVREIRKKYNELKELQREGERLNEPFLVAWMDVAKTFGEDVRSRCNNYDEPSGVCGKWSMEELSKTYRDRFQGLYRSEHRRGEPSHYRINVDRHPEICAVCHERDLIN